MSDIFDPTNPDAMQAMIQFLMQGNGMGGPSVPPGVMEALFGSTPGGYIDENGDLQALTPNQQANYLQDVNDITMDPAVWSAMAAFGAGDPSMLEPTRTYEVIDQPGRRRLESYLGRAGSIESIIANEILNNNGTGSTAVGLIRHMVETGDPNDPEIQALTLQLGQYKDDLNNDTINWNDVTDYARGLEADYVANQPTTGAEGQLVNPRTGEVISTGENIQSMIDPATGQEVMVRVTETPSAMQEWLDKNGLPSPFESYTPEDVNPSIVPGQERWGAASDAQRQSTMDWMAQAQAANKPPDTEPGFIGDIINRIRSIPPGATAPGGGGIQPGGGVPANPETLGGSNGPGISNPYSLGGTGGEGVGGVPANPETLGGAAAGTGISNPYALGGSGAGATTGGGGMDSSMLAYILDRLPVLSTMGGGGGGEPQPPAPTNPLDIITQLGQHTVGQPQPSVLPGGANPPAAGTPGLANQTPDMQQTQALRAAMIQAMFPGIVPQPTADQNVPITNAPRPWYALADQYAGMGHPGAGVDQNSLSRQTSPGDPGVGVGINRGAADQFDPSGAGVTTQTSQPPPDLTGNRYNVGTPGLGNVPPSRQPAPSMDQATLGTWLEIARKMLAQQAADRVLAAIPPGGYGVPQPTANQNTGRSPNTPTSRVERNGQQRTLTIPTSRVERNQQGQQQRDTGRARQQGRGQSAGAGVQRYRRNDPEATRQMQAAADRTRAEAEAGYGAEFGAALRQAQNLEQQGITPFINTMMARRMAAMAMGLGG